MTKPAFTHLVFLNDNIDPEVWSLYEPFCTEVQYKGHTKKHAVILSSDINFTNPSYLQITAHFKSNQQIKLNLPSSLVLLIQEMFTTEKIVIGFAPEIS